MSRHTRRRRKSRRKRVDYLKRWRRRVITLGIISGLVYGIFFLYHNLYSLVVDYASTQTVNLATLLLI